MAWKCPYCDEINHDGSLLRCVCGAEVAPGRRMPVPEVEGKDQDAQALPLRTGGAAMKLPMGRILVDAFRVPWKMRRRMSDVLLFPLLAMIAMGALDFYLKYIEVYRFFALLLTLGRMLIYTVLAVRCHRLVLLGNEGMPEEGLKCWSRRESRFLGWSIGLTIPLAVCFLASFFFLYMTIQLYMLHNTSGWDTMSFIKENLKTIIIIVFIPVAYLLGRLGFVFPVIAIDKRPTTSWAWRFSKGNGWRTGFIIGMLPMIFSLVSSPLTSGGPSILAAIFYQFLVCAVWVFEVSALSLSFLVLSGNAESVK